MEEEGGGGGGGGVATLSWKPPDGCRPFLVDPLLVLWCLKSPPDICGPPSTIPLEKGDFLHSVPRSSVIVVCAAWLKLEERSRGGGGFWDPKVCVPQMTRPDFPDGKVRFSHGGHVGLGMWGTRRGGGGGTIAKKKTKPRLVAAL